MANTEILGRVPIIRDTYSATETYYKDNIVYYDGGYWVAKKTDGITGITPEDGEYWAVLGGGASKMLSITYSELKALKDAGKLTPSQQYRITDYTCTTTQVNTQSAGHQFDIIVTADTETTLNEIARAVLHEGDTYFANCNLSAWKLWYSFDNDTTRFNWADATNGKGVIYRMIDEKNNYVPYDFKNIQFNINSSYIYTFNNDGDDDSVNGFCYNNSIGELNGNIQQLNNITFGKSAFSNKVECSCLNIIFDDYCAAITVHTGCGYLKVLGATLPSAGQYIQYVNISGNISGNDPNYKTITIPRNTTYTTEVRSSSDIILNA